MTQIKAKLTPELLRQLIHFDEAGGKYFWRPRPLSMFVNERSQRSWHTKFCGKEAMTEIIPSGYRRVTIFGERLLAHRVVWAFHYGEWPHGSIDHINGIGTDNRVSNLRIVDHAENSRNCRLSSRNQSGVTGVSLRKATAKWYVRISQNGRVKRLGTFENKDDAIAARKAAEIEFGYHANHGTVR